MAYFHTNVLDNQIKALPTVGTASGSVATFETDLTEDLIECVCEVASGSDSVSVFVNSVNMWDEEWESGRFDTTTGNPIVEPSQIRTKNTFKVLPDTLYRTVIGGGSIWGFFYDANDNLINSPIEGITQSNYAYGIGNKVFRTPINAVKCKFYFTSAYGTTYNNNTSFNYPSTEQNYNAFNGKIINLGETLNGNGSLDVISGILTRFDDTTKQLDANTIQTANGENNIWCDTGDTSVKFILSIGEHVNQNV